MKKIFTILGLVSATTIMFAQTNLVQNPGFESDLTSWAAGTGSGYTAPAILTTNPHSGLKLAAYELPSATTGFYQNVAIAGSTQYTLTFWYKASTTRPEGTNQNNIFRLWSVMKDTAGTPVYNTATAADDPLRSNNGYLPIAPTAWTQHTVVFTSHPSAASIDVAFRSYGSGSSYVDDVQLVQGLLAVTDVSAFDKSVKMNTVVGNELRLILPGKATVNIYSADGRLVSSNRVDNGQAINTSSMAKGNYIVTVDNGSAKVSRKVIKN